MALAKAAADFPNVKIKETSLQTGALRTLGLFQHWSGEVNK